MNIQHDIYCQLSRARVGRSLLALVLLCPMKRPIEIRKSTKRGRRELSPSIEKMGKRGRESQVDEERAAGAVECSVSIPYQLAPMDGGNRRELPSSSSSSGQMSNLATSRNQLLFSRFSPVYLWLQDEANWRVRMLLLREFREGRDQDILAMYFSLWRYFTSGIMRYIEPLRR
jgi:hypothetical protein